MDIVVCAGMTPFSVKPSEAHRKRARSPIREKSGREVEGAGTVMDLQLASWDLTREHLQQIVQVEQQCKHRGVLWGELDIHTKDVVSAMVHTVDVVASLV